MYRHLLLAVTLGAVAMLPAPASAHGPVPVHPNVVSSLDFRIVLHDGPDVRASSASSARVPQIAAVAIQVQAPCAAPALARAAAPPHAAFLVSRQ